MIKNVLSTLLSLSIIASCPLTAFAMVSTPSQVMKVPVATSSNALLSQDYMETDDFDTLDVPVLISDGGYSSSSTIDFTGSKLNLRYYDMMNRVKDVSVNLDADGYGSISRPSDFVKSVEIEIRLFKNNLPSAGKYNMNVHFGSNTGGFTYTDAFVWSGKNNKNAGMQQQQTFIDFSQGSGDFNISTIVEIGNIDYLNVGAYSSGIIPPVGGFFTVSFTKVSGSVAPDVTTAGGSYSSGDALADNTAQQVEQGETIIELIKNTIQTISSQLTAFWNQLAGEFTNLYNKMNQQHADQLQADRDNTEDIINSQESNTTNIINNNNENTEKITNGYDSSRLDNSNALLNDSIHNMQENEKQLMEDVSNNINDFQYTDYFTRIKAPLSDISYFLSGIYDNLKGLNIPIGFSLTLTIAMLCIGYYRFKGGT